MNWREQQHLVVGLDALSAILHLLQDLGIEFKVKNKKEGCCECPDFDCHQRPLRLVTFKIPVPRSERKKGKTRWRKVVIEEVVALDGQFGDNYILIRLIKYRPGHRPQILPELVMP